jgi:hypothetical protein
MQSNTTINICTAKMCFYIAILTTTCFGLYIGHHQVVHSFIFKANYTIYKVFVNSYFKCRFYRCARDLFDKNIVYFIVCFKNKRMYNLMMTDIAAETCLFKTIYVETPLSNTNINSCVWLHFIDTCAPIKTTGMSRLKNETNADLGSRPHPTTGFCQDLVKMAPV